MRKVTVTYKDTEVAPVKTDKWEQEIMDKEEAAGVLNEIAQILLGDDN